MPLQGSFISSGGTVTPSSTDTFTNKTFNGTGVGNVVSNMLTESTEQNTTPVADNTNSTVVAGARHFVFFTVPSTYKFIRVTGIEWKNGSTVSGNIQCGIDYVNANPPTQAATVLSALGQQTTQSGLNVVQRTSMIKSDPIRASTLLGVWVMIDNATGTFSFLSAQPNQNENKSTTYTAVVANQDTNAWNAATVILYIKVYFVGYT